MHDDDNVDDQHGDNDEYLSSLLMCYVTFIFMVCGACHYDIAAYQCGVAALGVMPCSSRMMMRAQVNKLGLFTQSVLPSLER